MVGYITTPAGKEVKKYGEFDSKSIESMTSAFAESNQLLRSLKLGSAERIVVSSASSTTVQTMVSGNSGSLMTTAVGSTLDEAFINSSVLNDATHKVLS